MIGHRHLSLQTFPVHWPKAPKAGVQKLPGFTPATFPADLRFSAARSSTPGFLYEPGRAKIRRALSRASLGAISLQTLNSQLWAALNPVQCSFHRLTPFTGSQPFEWRFLFSGFLKEGANKTFSPAICTYTVLVARRARREDWNAPLRLPSLYCIFCPLWFTPFLQYQKGTVATCMCHDFNYVGEPTSVGGISLCLILTSPRSTCWELVREPANLLGIRL